MQPRMSFGVDELAHVASCMQQSMHAGKRALKAHQCNIEVKRLAPLTEAHAEESMALGGWIHDSQHKVARAVCHGLHSNTGLPQRHRAHSKNVPTASGNRRFSGM